MVLLPAPKVQRLLLHRLDKLAPTLSAPSSSSGVDANLPLALGIAAECVRELAVSRHLQVVQRREALAPDGCGLSRDVQVALHHGQRRMSQVLFQQEDVAAVQEERSGVGMPKQMRV